MEWLPFVTTQHLVGVGSLPTFAARQGQAPDRPARRRLRSKPDSQNPVGILRSQPAFRSFAASAKSGRG